MDNKIIFDTVRPWLDSAGFTNERIAALDGALARYVMPSKEHRLANEAAFFAGVRDVTGGLSQPQVDVVKSMIAATAHWPLGWLAYGLATAWHEALFKPQPEWGFGRGRPYAALGAHGQSQYGRGLVQLTWDKNYEWADKALGLDGKLLANFNLALEPDIAVRILVKGMEEGAFTGHGLSKHLPGWRGTHEQFVEARRIINGTDKAEKIAKEADGFQRALEQGGYV